MTDSRRTVRVVAAAIVDAGRVLAARRAPDAARGGLWELPGGKVEPGESDADALVREIQEELGAEVIVDRFLGEATHDYGDIRITLAAWACRPAREATFTLHEHDAVRWLGPEALDTVAWAPADVPLLEAVAEALRQP